MATNQAHFAIHHWLSIRIRARKSRIKILKECLNAHLRTNYSFRAAVAIGVDCFHRSRCVNDYGYVIWLRFGAGDAA